MNIHASPASAKPILQFKVGDFVRIQNSEIVGRVIEDTEAGGATAVNVFDDDTWGDNPKFGPGVLSMWTPTPIPPAVPVVIVRPVIDTGSATDLAMRMLAMAELAEDLGRLAANEDDSPLAYHMQVIGSVVSETSCALLEILFAEQSRQEALSDSGED